MPLYEYLCPKCSKVTEKTFRITSFPKIVKCKFCNAYAHKIVSASAIQTDAKVKWLPSACQTLQREHERPIETRGEYKKYLKENNLICKG